MLGANRWCEDFQSLAKALGISDDAVIRGSSSGSLSDCVEQSLLLACHGYVA